MATDKQRQAARENIKKAQEKWQSMTKRQRTLAQPEGKNRARPGTTGEGEYYRIIVRPKGEFTTFRNQDVGKPGGSWATHAWLISKEDAHMEGDELVPDSDDARELLATLGSKPVHKKGDLFTAKDRRNVPEKDKPTPAQQRAQRENIKKAQAARHRSM